MLCVGTQPLNLDHLLFVNVMAYASRMLFLPLFNFLRYIFFSMPSSNFKMGSNYWPEIAIE